ncbi:nucleotide exchange factor GrpE [Hoylesella nanceiensis]|jgi:grpE|uniref:nucleotide exchange factor GrpE n=1 Tax=Hoylesella nanceiensis TaxID=425941 RepID=UPI0027B9713C|nr:nucleotide exchange factor GrpE [Hoylesella nanceiensis]
MSNTEQNTEKEFLNEESLNTKEATNTAESQDVCNETISQGEPVETVETLKAELETLKDKYLRTVAEFDNYKKRTLKEKTELILNGSEKTVTTFLPILDDMERAIANAGKSTDITAIEEGWELIYNKFIKQLDSIGVKKIETNDADFDVDYHEAVAMVPGMGDDKKGKVIDCVQTGYTLNDKVIRHAKVAVGQ